MLRHYLKKSPYLDALSSVCYPCIAETVKQYYENKTVNPSPFTTRNIKLIHAKETSLDGVTYLLKFQVFPSDENRKVFSYDQALVTINGKTGTIQVMKYCTIKEV